MTAEWQVVQVDGNWRWPDTAPECTNCGYSLCKNVRHPIGVHEPDLSPCLPDVVTTGRVGSLAVACPDCGCEFLITDDGRNYQDLSAKE